MCVTGVAMRSRSTHPPRPHATSAWQLEFVSDEFATAVTHVALLQQFLSTPYFGKYSVGHTTAVVPAPALSAYPHFPFSWQQGFVSDELATAVPHVAPSQQFFPTPYSGKYPVGRFTAVVPAPALSAYPHFLLLPGNKGLY